MILFLLQINGVKVDGHVPGLRRAHGTGCQVKVLGFAQEEIQERATGKWKKVYLETYTFHMRLLSKGENGPGAWGHLRSWEKSF